MGGAFSGRRGGKPLVEDCLTIDLVQLMRLGPLEDGMAGHGGLEWSLDGQGIGSIKFRLDLRKSEAARLTIAYAITSADGQRKTVSQRVRLTATVPQFGGRRWWMLCPVTGARVRCLHLPPGGERFASRKAWGLSYRTERLGQFDKPFQRLFRHQRRLGMQGWGAMPARPKGMWQRTWRLHLGELAALDAQCGSVILRIMGAPAR